MADYKLTIEGVVDYYIYPPDDSEDEYDFLEWLDEASLSKERFFELLADASIIDIQLYDVDVKPYNGEKDLPEVDYRVYKDDEGPDLNPKAFHNVSVDFAMTVALINFSDLPNSRLRELEEYLFSEKYDMLQTIVEEELSPETISKFNYRVIFRP